MAIEADTFKSIIPSRYISFTIPNFTLPNFTDYLHSKEIRIAVLDSPIQEHDCPPQVAAMLVPKNREKDWIFATKSGHLQLIFSCHGISRLILIGNGSIHDDDACIGMIYRREIDDGLEKVERRFYPLLMGLLPVESAKLGEFEVPFLRYEDSVLSSVVLERCVGSFVGEMLVEDVEIEGSVREFRRRLRFKRMPNLVQTEIRIVPRFCNGNGFDSDCIGEVEFEPDLSVLVHPYLAPMVASLSLVGGYLEDCFESRMRPKALCIGVGGGALLSFLHTQLGLDVVGVEVDEVVLKVAKKYFGLQTDERVRVCVGDGIEIFKNMACCESKDESFISDNTKNVSLKNEFDAFSCKFEIIMVDLDSSDCLMGISAPGPEFMQKDTLLAVKSSLSDHGILVLNVILSSRSLYEGLICEFRKVFGELYEIDTGNGENVVLIATVSSISLSFGASENAFMTKLKCFGTIIDSIRKI